MTVIYYMAGAGIMGILLLWLMAFLLDNRNK